MTELTDTEAKSTKACLKKYYIMDKDAPKRLIPKYEHGEQLSENTV